MSSTPIAFFLQFQNMCTGALKRYCISDRPTICTTAGHRALRTKRTRVCQRCSL